MPRFSASLRLTGALLFALVCFFAPAFARQAFAGSIVVNNSTCILADAIVAANTNSNYAGCFFDGSYPAVLELAAGEHKLTSVVETSTGTQPIVVEVVIVGDDAGSTIVRDSNDLFRLLWVEDVGKLTIENVTLSNGYGGQSGGAIMVAGVLTVTDSIFVLNSAELTGGALYVAGGATPGTAVISNTVFMSNTAENGGAIFGNDATITITNSELIANSAFYGGAELV